VEDDEMHPSQIRFLLQEGTNAMVRSRNAAADARAYLKERNYAAALHAAQAAAHETGSAEAYMEAAHEGGAKPSKARDGKLKRAVDNVESLFDRIWDVLDKKLGR
jgi:hypothetical protein